MSRRFSPQIGVSLIEMLVALIVFSIGLLGIAGLQTVSKQANFEGLQRTTAAQIANGLLEEIRTNADAVGIYLAAGDIGNGSFAAEPAPNCSGATTCNADQKAAHDLWQWEQMLDGNLETNGGGSGTGGLVMPTLCLTGPALAGAGVYRVTVVWRGSAAMNNAVANPCGSLTGNYGAANEFRRIVQIPTFIDPSI